MVQDPAREMVNKIANVDWIVVESRTCGQDSGSGLGQGEHVLEVDWVQGGFSGHNYQGPLFLEGNVRGPMDEVVAQPVADRGQAGHRAGANDHAAMGP